MIRLFAALALPEAVRRELALRQQGLREARWRPLDSLHITLRFFGEMAEDRARDLDEALLAAGGPRLQLELEGLGAFGEGDDIRAVWAGVAENEPLRRLAARCDRAARQAGLPADARAFRPHVTLAYTRRPDPRAVGDWIAAGGALRSAPFTVDRFGLYSSWRTREGSNYRLEADYPLAG